MTILKFRLRGLLPGLLLLTAIGSAQYYYPQGYYYPPPGYGYGAPQQPPQQQAPQAARESRPAAKKPADNSGAKPPAADVSEIKGPLHTYLWDYRDTLSDLGKATGVTANQILALNNLALSQLRDGQALKVPEFLETTTSLDIKRDQQSQRQREVWRGLRGEKRIALTFDAGGIKDGADKLLQALVTAEARATFFATGEFAEKHGALLKQISDAGYPIHNHSWSHPEFTKLTDDEIRSQLKRADDAISSATGKSTKPFWRPPFGDRDDRVLRLAAEAGYQSIYWTIDSLDSVGDQKSADFVLNRVLNPDRGRANPEGYLDGAIILMHVGEVKTAEAVPQMIRQLREKGFQLVTVEQLLKP